MTEPRHLAHWRELDLHSAGRSLIEASAGTGKTWTIAVLYLRLLLEGETPRGPREIVVSTFTEAAAQELRERLRARLAWAQRAAEAYLLNPVVEPAGDAADDLAWLQQRWPGTAQARADLLRLRLAQAELDLAPIGTLHSLCRRILADFPVESGSAFAAGDVIAEGPVLELLVDDLWRELMQGSEPLAEGDALWAAGSRDALRDALRSVLAPGVGVRTATPAEPLSASEWQQMRGLAQQLVAEPGLFKTSRSALLTALGRFVAACEAGQQHDFDADSVCKHALALDSQLKPTHPQREQSVQQLQRLFEALQRRDSRGAASKAAALERYRERLLLRRRESLLAQARLTFNMLIEGAAAALRDAESNLARRLAQQWPVALVDEFQDTDAQQYGILDAIYRHGDGSPRGRLVMIGDPKQAIYRFRGGDIHTYLQAAATAQETLWLDTNRRSSLAYVTAMNAWYAAAGPALSVNEQHPIAYVPVKAAGRDATPYRRADGEIEQEALVFHYCSDDPLKADERRARALGACAAQIAGLLQSGRRIGERLLQPGDIAVLLPKNAQVEQLRNLLRARGVPCVGAGKRSVFQGELARELQIVLYAVDRYQDDGAVLAALATRFGAQDFQQLRALHSDAEAWQRERLHFETLRHRWQHHGVLAVVLALADALVARLPQQDQRERALTDLRHLGELLQQQSDQLAGSEQLLAWLHAQRESPEQGEAADEQQLRLESDAQRVRLLTLHASKGLEFPVVFLPLMWDHGGREPDLPLVFDPHSGRRLAELLREGREDALREVRSEDQEERFRVLYVALTRAEHACHVYLLPPARPRDGRSGAAALADPDRSALDATVARLQQHGGLPALAQLGWQADDWIFAAAQYAAAAPGLATLSARREPPKPLFEHTYSFTSLVATRREDQEAAAADDEGPLQEQNTEIGEVEITAEQPADDRILALAPLRGPQFGNAVHLLFEQRRPDQPLADQAGLIERSLREYAVRHEPMPLSTVVAELAGLVQRTLDTAILPGLRLGTLPARRQRAEMGFQFSLGGVSLRRLREVCTRLGAAELLPPQLPATVVSGLMSGKIDLIVEHEQRFHVLDYKTNYLGDRIADYAPAALQTAMHEHHYPFQALLYTVALERYLRQRLPQYRREQHLGESIYLFVRGIGLGPQAGVWRHRFAPALLDAVDAVFADVEIST